VSLRVIGAGVGRTGTTSLKVALERLLGDRCYHMYEVFRQPGDVAVWRSAARGTEPDWDELFEGFAATVDWPAAAFWKPLSEAYPDALVLLSVRDSTDDWFGSAEATIGQLLQRTPPPSLKDWREMSLDLLATTFAPIPFEAERAKAAYDRHNAEVRDAIPPERLLEWRVTDGWEPICERLGLDVPDEPFPHLNTSDDYAEMLARQPPPRSLAKRSGDLARRYLETHPRVRAPLARLKGKLPRRPPEEPADRVIFEFARAYPDATFVQVGANDGIYTDPLRAEIRARRWRGVMVEPVPYVFEKLRATYGSNKRITLENSAISVDEGARELYHLAEAGPAAPGLPSWYDNLGSFHKDVILKHRDAIPDFDERLVSIEVQCLTFASLCRKHGLDSIDLIQVDTEGHDYEILKLVDLDALRPRIVMYEQLHFDEATRQACTDYLISHGYEQLADEVNVVCLRTVDLGERDRSLHRLWQQLLAASPG
jgi:FkbM family methyltransferase